MAEGWPRTLSVPFGSYETLAIVVRRAAGEADEAAREWSVEVTSAQGEALLRRAFAAPQADVLVGATSSEGRILRCIGGRVYQW